MWSVSPPEAYFTSLPSHCSALKIQNKHGSYSQRCCCFYFYPYAVFMGHCNLMSGRSLVYHAHKKCAVKSPLGVLGGGGAHSVHSERASSNQITNTALASFLHRSIADTFPSRQDYFFSSKKYVISSPKKKKKKQKSYFQPPLTIWVTTQFEPNPENLLEEIQSFLELSRKYDKHM